jgi:hypothetical protein
MAPLARVRLRRGCWMGWIMNKAVALADVGRVLNPDNYRTGMDRFSSSARIQYQRGLDIGQKVCEVALDGTGILYAVDGNIERKLYERIGVHAHSADLWRGVLDSGCRIVVLCDDGSRILVREALVNGRKS